jgi:adenylate cyclase
VRTTKSSLAVLPFRNLDGDPQQDYVVDGLTDDLITDISRFTRMSVLARDKVFAFKGHSEDVIRVGRELGVDHVLEGSVRRSGDRVRLNAKLIDVKTGHNVWAQRFDRELEDLFEVQDEMTRAIVAELEVQILEGEQAKSWQRGTDNPSALDLFRRSRAAGVPMSLQGFREGLSYLQQAVAIDPRYARAWAGVAMLGTATLMYGLPSGQSEMLTMSGKAADEALALDPKLAEAWMAKGHHLLYEGKRAEAEEAARKSLVLSVDANIVRTGAARIYLFTGRTEAAIALAQEVARNKKSAISRHPLVVIGMGTLVLGRYDEAIAAVLAHVQALPFNPLTRLIRAAAYAGLGQETEAREEGSHFKRLVHEEPFTPMAKWMLPFLEQESRDRIVGLLHKAEVE